MECFRQIARLFKAPFKRNTPKALEIGPPTDFRKEESPMFFSDDDRSTLTSHSIGSTLGKTAAVSAFELRGSTREKIKQQVRRMSVKTQDHQPLPDCV